MLSGVEMEIETQAIFERRADMHGDMIFLLDLVSECFYFSPEEGCDVLCASDAGEPLFKGVDLTHVGLTGG